MRLTLVQLIVGCAAALFGCGSSPGTTSDLAVPPFDLAVAAPVDLVATPDLSEPTFGLPCDPDGNCAAGLFCLAGPNGGSFCSKTCPANSSGPCPGAPPGTAAYCVVTGVDPQNDKGCAFACKEPNGGMFQCPGQLQCETTDDPPGSGQRLCIPQ